MTIQQSLRSHAEQPNLTEVQKANVLTAAARIDYLEEKLAKAQNPAFEVSADGFAPVGLRDMIALAALPAVIADARAHGSVDNKAMAITTYALADAVLKERNNGRT